MNNNNTPDQTATVNEILDDLQKLATREGWTQIAMTAANLRQQGQRSDILIASPAGIDPVPFQRWLTTQIDAAHCKCSMGTLTELLAHPYPALEAGTLIATIPCGHILAPAEVDAIEQLFLSRPIGTTAFVLTGAEQIEDGEDMALVERSAWRLLVREPKTDWNQQPIRPHNCYLWSDHTDPGFATERIIEDMATLKTWLQTPAEGEQREMLRKIEAIYLLNAARAYISTSQQGITLSSDTSGTPTPNLTSNSNQNLDQNLNNGKAQLTDQQLRDAHERIGELRRRWTRRLDADASNLERQLTTSLQTLGLDMQQNLNGYLTEEFRRYEPRTLRELKQLLTNYISQNAQKWHRETQDLVRQRRDEIAGDTEALLQGIEWDIINEAVQHRATYPQALGANVVVPLDISTLSNGLDDLEESAYKTTSGNTVQLRFAATGAVVGAVAMFLLGIGPMGILAGGAGAALGGKYLSDRLLQGQSLQNSEEYGKLAIGKVIQHATARVRQETQERFQQVRDSVKRDLEALEAILEDSLVERRRDQTSLTLVEGGGSLNDQLDSFIRQLVLVDASEPPTNSN